MVMWSFMRPYSRALPGRVSVLLLFLLVSMATAHADWFKQPLDVMGTRVQLEFWHEDLELANACRDLVFAEMFRIDALMSTYKEDSELSAINRHAASHEDSTAASKSIKVSDELYGLFEKSKTFSEMSNGAFDITYASVGYLYDYRKQQQPSQKVIQQKLGAIDYKKLILKNQSVRFATSGMRLDLGGIAKGYAVDQAIKILQQCGITQALVSAGGDTRILGDRQGESWIIGIQHPRDENALALRLPLTDSAISTSGDYERFFIANDERFHHIINPETGASAKKSWSATVIGPDATTTDALSTTVFILGAEEGIRLINTLDNIDAIVIDSSGVVHYSSGLEDPVKSMPLY